MNGTGTALLRAERLTKSFSGRTVVKGVTIEVSAGEVVGLLGPNGAGKTTSFHMIVGLQHPDSGQVFLNGENLTELPMYERARRGIGYLPQEASVFRKLTVEENNLAILETLDLGAEQRRKRLGALLEELGIARLARTRRSHSRAANGDGSRSHAPSSSLRRSCCSTSRSPASTPLPWLTFRA